MPPPANTPERDRNRGYDPDAIEHCQQELRESARSTLAVIADLDDAVRQAAERRVEVMKLMADTHMSWAEIGRIWGVSPQAAMYATGHATRTRGKEPAATKPPAKKAAVKKTAVKKTAAPRTAAAKARSAV